MPPPPVTVVVVLGPAEAVAIVVGDIDHVPVVASLKDIVEPSHTTELAPVIAGGEVFTVTVAVRAHVVGNVYTTVTSPAVPGVISPVTGSIVAEPVPADTDHVPPAGVALRVLAYPVQIISGPPPTLVITDGSGLTVTTVSLEQEPTV